METVQNNLLLFFCCPTLVSRAGEAPPEHIQHLVEDIRVPMGAGAASDH